MSDCRTDAFQRALDEAALNNREPSDDGPGPRVRRVAFGAAPGTGGKARFGLALDWTEPTDRPPPLQPLPRDPDRRPGDTSIEIAAEIGAGAALTLDQLTSRWRDFVWRNHPDRQPEAVRERANARVAIANTLYDRARRELASAAAVTLRAK